MNKLLKFLKPYVGAVFAILCVLIVQAYCDLSLPAYTSDIVNVGIQQGGISETVPEEIGEEDFDKLLLFVASDKQDAVKDAYAVSKKDYDYAGRVYTLKQAVRDDSKELDKLSGILGRPMLLVSGFESGSDMTKKMQDEMKSQMKSQMQMQAQSRLPDVDSMSMFEIFENMEPEQRDEAVAQIEKNMVSMPETMIEQAATTYIKNAYSNIGIDTDNKQNNYILTTGGKMLALAALGMMASILVGLLASRVGASVGRGIRGDVFKKVVGFSNGEFDKFSTASLITRSTNDIQQIQMLTVMILRMVLYAPIMAIGGIWKVFNTNADMSWIIGLAVGLILCVVVVLFVVVMPKFKTVQNLVDRLNLVSREILTGLPVIRAFSTEKYEEKRFDRANMDLTRVNLFVNRAMTFMMPTMMLIMNGVTVLIVWSGAHNVNDGTMQVGDMMAFIQYTMQIIMSFLMICMISVMLPRAAVSAVRVDEVLRSSTLIHDPEDAEALPQDGRGEVTFDHVSFRYPGAEEDVLHNLTFTARPGQTTAIIGSTGSGKTTLVNLIPRFYDVTEGQVLIDGTDVRSISQHELRDQLGFVPQKGILFSGDIASNIMYGNPGGSEEEMREAAEIAQATEFIESKKKKYESAISQGGSNVSGGQKQRLSIARAIAKHPKVYIFDDSFSALDYKTDVTLRNALKEKTADSTVIIVAQRISTILHAEQIIVLDDGVIAGIGTHKELLKNCDAYYQIASSQLSEKELSEDMKEVD
ncbi:ABC transporter ATP-binding protein [Extibacter muris]|uniref:ABC transporter ATP-binding protein n=1 Tax=Extibacter muris TaxID=1796622 RepID=UPI001D080296|nr:ABC transporter ATP-binding protein [Extibacter muris]MCB6201792.1 ABC transporter ATP-binding protein/permease [Extibacter muris]MCQ4663583.1 ABC transporter ATP-binding protein/permease [Extibacter muris]MCQ4695044.1 ABC transporter ATP-binding protein/permease [Extibacter muris]